MSSRKTKARSERLSNLREVAYVLTFPALMLIWAVQSYA